MQHPLLFESIRKRSYKKIRGREILFILRNKKILEDLKKLKNEELGILHGPPFRELRREGRFSEIVRIIREIYKDFKRNIEEFRIKDLSFPEKMAFSDTMLVPIWGSYLILFKESSEKSQKT